LRFLVAEGRQISVRTAGALRTSAELIEDYRLIDQPERASAAAVGSAEAPSSFSFDGERRLTRSESDGLRRAVRFLHAVIVGRDHSGGLLRSWVTFTTNRWMMMSNVIKPRIRFCTAS